MCRIYAINMYVDVYVDVLDSYMFGCVCVTYSSRTNILNGIS